MKKEEKCQIISVRGEVCVWDLSSKKTKPVTAGQTIANPATNVVVTNLSAFARVKYNGEVVEVPESSLLSFSNGMAVCRYFTEAPHFFAKDNLLVKHYVRFRNKIKNEVTEQQQRSDTSGGVRG